ncbi:MAG: hypothetical protein IT376_11305 [Polyangiaceae bacterium]|nr:hypothetical protein [Polyangiaceae bacterium]
MRAAALLSSVVAAASCAVATPRGDAPRSRPRAGAAPSSRPRPPERWPRAGELAGWTLAAPPFRSAGHHAGAVDVEIRLPAELIDAYRRLPPGRRLPDGATAAAIHRAPGGAVDVYVIELGADGWRFLVLAPDATIRRQGRLGDCLRCHAEAPRGGLFGLPSTAGGSETSPP